MISNKSLFFLIVILTILSLYIFSDSLYTIRKTSLEFEQQCHSWKRLKAEMQPMSNYYQTMETLKCVDNEMNKYDQDNENSQTNRQDFENYITDQCYKKIKYDFTVEESLSERLCRLLG